MDYYNELFEPGCRISIKLKNLEIFTGIFAEGGKNHIALAEPYLQNTKTKLSACLYEFYRSEILEIRKLAEPTKAPVLNGEAAASAPQEEVTHSQKVKTIKLSESEYFRLKEVTKSFVHIKKADQQYVDAVKLLGDADTIGVACPGLHPHRHGNVINLLVMCTWKCVFIFDLTCIDNKKISSELKDILECEYISKVIHKSAGLVDILCRMYNIYVQNVFDTHVVDLMFQKSSGEGIEERDLGECLSHHLHLPSSLLSHSLNVTIAQWAERPMNDKLKIHASQLVAYLIPLNKYFQKNLLKDVYKTIEQVQDQVYDMEDFDYIKYNLRKRVPKKVLKLIPKNGT